jgi:hypothetical protein
MRRATWCLLGLCLLLLACGDAAPQRSVLEPDAGLPGPEAPELDATAPRGTDDADADGTDDTGPNDPFDASDGNATTNKVVEEDEEGGTDAEAGVDPSDDAGDAGLDGFTAKLRSCTLLGPGPFVPLPVNDEWSRCIEACLVAIDCEQLKLFLCEQAPISDLFTCQSQCPFPSETSGARCASDDTPLWPSMLCDGLSDCADSSDEAGCETFACDASEKVVVARRCDGFLDCTNGADEADCAPLLCD